jgi:hypothetical protein
MRITEDLVRMYALTRTPYTRRTRMDVHLLRAPHTHYMALCTAPTSSLQWCGTFLSPPIDHARAP